MGHWLREVVVVLCEEASREGSLTRVLLRGQRDWVHRFAKGSLMMLQVDLDLFQLRVVCSSWWNVCLLEFSENLVYPSITKNYVCFSTRRFPWVPTGGVGTPWKHFRGCRD